MAIGIQFLPGFIGTENGVLYARESRVLSYRLWLCRDAQPLSGSEFKKEFFGLPAPNEDCASPRRVGVGWIVKGQRNHGSALRPKAMLP